MTPEELKKRKKELGLTNQEIADLSGVPLGTVQKIFAGTTRSPRYDSLVALEKILFPSSKGTYEKVLRESAESERGVRETTAPWPVTAGNGIPSGSGYTYNDYIALPEDVRAELIDGRFYAMAAPNSKHQIIIGQLYLQLHACTEKQPGCMALLSPMDVMPDEDDRTVVQPDIMLLCDRSKLRKGRVFGAPDLVIEVVSPGYRSKDYYIKATKYMMAGVREYWIVDYARQKVLIHLAGCRDAGQEPGSSADADVPEDPADIFIYGMDAVIPIAISDGSCSIDMRKIRDVLDDLGDI